MRHAWRIVLLSAVSALATSCAPQTRVYPGPDGEPIPVRGQAFRPTEADGLAILACNVTRDGRLANCEVVEERPEGRGLGHVALQMAAEFRMRVDESTWSPDARVRIPFHAREP